MAVWQAQFRVTPTGPWPATFVEQLDAVAPRVSYLTETRSWGRPDSHCLDIFLEGGLPASGRLRLDLRAWDAGWVERAITALAALGAELATPDGRAVALTPADVTLAARGSPAFRFVENPWQFLRRLAAGGLEDA